MTPGQIQFVAFGGLFLLALLIGALVDIKRQLERIGDELAYRNGPQRRREYEERMRP